MFLALCDHSTHSEFYFQNYYNGVTDGVLLAETRYYGTGNIDITGIFSSVCMHIAPTDHSFVNLFQRRGLGWSYYVRRVLGSSGCGLHVVMNFKAECLMERRYKPDRLNVTNVRVSVKIDNFDLVSFG